MMSHKGIIRFGLQVSSSLLLILGWSLPRRCDTAHVVYRDLAENTPLDDRQTDGLSATCYLSMPSEFHAP